MTYYPTLEEDLARAKEILAKGKGALDTQLEELIPKIDKAARETFRTVLGGTIYGADTYAAYRLLESFVAELERKGPAEARRLERHDALVRKVKRQRKELRSLNRSLKVAQLTMVEALRRAHRAEENLRQASRYVMPFREVPALYDVAKETCHSVGVSWRDPRTGEVFPPPAGEHHE